MSNGNTTPAGQWSAVRAGDPRWFHNPRTFAELRFARNGDVEVSGQAGHMRMATTVLRVDELQWILEHRAWLLDHPDGI